jgi:DNA transformation protein
MKSNNDFAVYVRDEFLREVDGITIRRMFDGHGIYRHGVFVGLINQGIIYLKVDTVNQKDFEERGSKPFVYTGHTGKPVTLSFWELPAEIMDDSQEIVPWITGAYEAALRSKHEHSK